MLTKLKPKQTIEAAGLSRIWQHIQENSVATISAFRGYRRDAFSIFREQLNEGLWLGEIPEAQAYRIPKAENMKRHRDLGQLLAYKNLHYMQINGMFQEEGMDKPQPELSYFVWHKDFNKLKKDIIELGTLFEQDAVCVVEQGAKNGAMYNTSPDDIKGNGNEPIGAVLMKFRNLAIGYRDRGSDGNLQQYFSSLRNRPFHFKGIESSAKYVGISSITGETPTSIYCKTLRHPELKTCMVWPDKITTEGNIYSKWTDLTKPHPDRTHRNEAVMEKLYKDIEC